jgi:hypothetical protein
LRDLFIPYGGTYPVSDEGWYGIFNVNILPSCASTTIPTNVPNIRYVGDFITVAAPEFNYLNWATTADVVYNNAANLDVIPVTTLIDASDTLRWDTRVENTTNVAGANNSFLAFRSRRGTIQVFNVIDLATNLPVPSTNGIYRLNTLAASTTSNYRIEATQSSCVLDTLVAYTGWDCVGYPANLAAYTCALDSGLMYTKDPSTELQLLVVSPVDSADMCAARTYEIELTSAKASPISNLLARLTLSAGLSLVAGSVAYDYPLGAGYVGVADPTFAAGTHTFNISGYTPALQSLKGLLDATSSAERKVRVRFQVITDCSFISGDAFVVQAQATSVCGSLLPVLNYDVPPILIKGSVSTPYVTQIKAVTEPITACGEDHPYYYTINILNLGPLATRNVDNIVVRLPAGIYMQSYDPLLASQHNAPNALPTITMAAGISTLTWNMPDAVAAGDSILFKLRLEAATDPALCGAPLTSTVFTTINSSVLCISSATICNAQAANGNGAANISVVRPSLNINVASPNGSNQYNGITGINYIALQSSFSNAIQATTAGDTLVVDYYCDIDNSSTFTAGDNYIGSYAYTGGLSAGGTHNYIWRDTFPATTCDIHAGQTIIAVVQDTTDLNSLVQCACQYAQRPANDILLPVDFAAWSVSAENCSHKLTWATATETNNQYFAVERSANGVNFVEIARVNALGNNLGNSQQLQNYAFVDVQPLESVNYYRIKAVSHSNMSRQTAIAAVQNYCGKQNIRVFPVPAATSLTLELDTKAQTAEIRILNALGQTIKVETVQLNDGRNSFQLPINHLPAGAYLIQVQHDLGTWSDTFIKVD